MDRKVKAALLSVVSNTSLLVLKLVVGLISGSVSILSAAADSLNDLSASLIAFFSVRASAEPADEEHPYGHEKIENISGAIQAILILIAALYIIREAILRIIHPQPIETLGLGVVVMGVTFLVDLFVSRYLLRVAIETDSAAIKADAYHLTTDVWTSLGVLCALVLVRVTGVLIFDPIVALIVAGVILRVSFVLTRDAAKVLMDFRLPIEEIGILQQMVLRTPRVVGFHKLRSRRAGSRREIDYHLIVPRSMPVVDAHRIAEDIEDRMRAQFPNTHVVTHIEPDTDQIVSEPDTELRRKPTQRKTRWSPRIRRHPP